jgi:hypothetical protein
MVVPGKRSLQVGRSRVLTIATRLEDNIMFRGAHVLMAALLGLLSAASVSQAQQVISIRQQSSPSRPSAPSSSEVDRLKAERLKVKKELDKFEQNKVRYTKMKRELQADQQAWKVRRDANERFGKQRFPTSPNKNATPPNRFSREEHRRGHQKYMDTKAQLEREDRKLRVRSERLEQSGRGIDSDLAASRQRLRQIDDRLAALGAGASPSGRRFFFDDTAKKKAK